MGYKFYEEGSFGKASKAFLQVYASCSHNYNIVYALLQSILRSHNRELFHEGMKIMKKVLNNASRYMSGIVKGT